MTASFPRWLRRNRAALPALAGLSILGAAVIGGNEWYTASRDDPLVPIEVAPGDRVEHADTMWGPARLREATPADELSVPAGARAVVLEFTTVQGDEAIGCSVMLREPGGRHRSWNPASSWIGGACDREAAGPYEGSAAFILPDDVTTPLYADITVVRYEHEFVEFPPFIRFVIE